MKQILYLLVVLSASIAHAQTQVVPKDWIKPENLEGAQRPLQEQLDTGKDMINTAWSMARVRDAELFIAYITVWEKLPANGREALRKDQETWLKQREKAVKAADDGASGQVGRLQAASEHQEMTAARLKEIKKRLPKK